MKKFVSSLFFLLFSVFYARAEYFVFSSDLLPDLEEKTIQFMEQVKELDPQEVQVLANFLYLSRLIASTDIDVRKNLDLFLLANLKAFAMADNYELTANLLNDSSVQIYLDNVRRAFDQRNQAYQLWKFADQYLENNASSFLSSIIDTLQMQGQEALLQFIVKSRDCIGSAINQLEKEKKFSDLCSVMTTAVNVSKLVNVKEAEDLDLLNLLRVASDGYYNTAHKSLELAMHLKEYVLLSEEFAYHFYGIYHDTIFSYLSEYYPQHVGMIFVIQDGICVVNLGNG